MRPSRLLFFIGAVAVAAPVGAQTVRERQVPLDPGHGITDVLPELRRELGLFPEAEGFVSARLFRQDDGTLVLEITRTDRDGLIHERRPLTDADLDAMRANFGDRLVALGRTRAVDRAGRSGLVLAESLLGIGVYGFAVPAGFDIDSSRGTVAAYLLTAGLSYYVPYRITRTASVSVAERNAAVWGATRGLVHGALLGRLVSGPDDPFGTDDGGSARAIAMLGTSVVETVLAYQSVEAVSAQEGDVAFWGAAGDFGIPYGLGAAYLAGLFERDADVCGPFSCVTDEFRWRRAGLATALAGALAAPVLAYRSGLGARYTIGDARALRSFGVLGAQVALVPAWAAWGSDDDDPGRGVVAALLAGSAAGLWLGDRVFANRSLSGGEGLLVLAGHVAGGLSALGVTYLLDSGERADDVVYLATAAAGSVAGATLTLRAVGGAVSAPSVGVADRLELTPAGALVPFLLGATKRAPVRAPLLTLRF